MIRYVSILCLIVLFAAACAPEPHDEGHDASGEVVDEAYDAGEAMEEAGEEMEDAIVNRPGFFGGSNS